MTPERLRAAATFFAYRASGAALGVLPEPMATAVAAVVGGVLARRPHGDLAVRERHVERVLASTSPAVGPDPAVVRRWALRSYRSYARYWVEGARLPTTSPAVVRRRIVLDWGYEHVEHAFASGRGVLLALPHIGSWEWGGAFLALDGHPMTSVAERVEPPALFRWFLEQREAMGLRIVPLDEESGGRTLLRELRSGGLVGLLCDRDIVGNGVKVEFFGEETTLPGGPATLALRTDAVLIPAAVYSGPGKQHFAFVTAPIDTSRTGSLRVDVARITQELAHRFEWMVRRAPEQWHLYQPNWPSDRDA
ncbi:MAG TPA: phosphatidylinositol mannoside acyltransferase [Acidimicrobiales bacterium]|nr:phosphatidylinositol mannoside acyltransferase [Acidimicrobiales bacterium]